MSVDRIVLTFPFTKARSLKSFFIEDGVVSWLYLGKDYLKRRLIERELGNKFQRIDIAKLHDEVAKHIRHEFVEWIDVLNRRYGHNIEWWFGSISSRSIYNSNVFQYCCYLEILDRLSNIDNAIPQLIVVESIGLVRSIEKWAKKKNLRILIINRQRVLLFIKEINLFILRWGKYFTTMVLRWIAAVFTKYQCNKKDLDQKPHFLVDTFIHDYCLSKNGTFKDRYFPYLHEYLRNKGKNVIIHPVLHGFHYNYFSIYKRMRMSNAHFLIQEDFLHLSDYLSSLTYPIRSITREIKANPFRGFDLIDIIQEEQKYHSSISGMYPILIYRLFARLGHKGFRPEKVINWYENQVIDRALIIGCHKAFSDTQILGVQMFIHPANYLNLFPCKSEVEFRVTPDIFLETSRKQCEKIQGYTQSITSSPVASLRYAHVFQNLHSNLFDIENKVILVLLPFDIMEAIELLEILKESVVQLRNNFKVYIKYHPDHKAQNPIQTFYQNQWPSQFIIFKDSLQDGFKQAAVVVSSNSSSLVEAVARGIPVISVGRQTVLNMNPLEDLNLDIYTECFTSEELAQAINRYFQISAADVEKFREMGQAVRDNFFTPINEQTMLPFLGDYVF